MFTNGMFGGTRQQPLRNSEKQCAAFYFAYLTHFSYISFVSRFCGHRGCSCSLVASPLKAVLDIRLFRWKPTVWWKTRDKTDVPEVPIERLIFLMNGRWLVLLRHLQLQPFLACYRSVSTKLKRKKFQGIKHTSLSPLPWIRCHADPAKFPKT